MKYRANILVVDDDAAVCRHISRVLRDEGYTVDTVLSGEAALDRETKGKYALVIADVVIPGMGGMDLLEKLKGRNHDLTVIMITGQPSIKTAVQSIKSGAFDYIPKPFTAEELRSVVLRALETRYFYERIAARTGKQEKKLVEIDLPRDLYCIPEHSWVRPEQDGKARLGIHHIFVRTINSIAAIDFLEEDDLKCQGDVCLKITDAHGQIHRLWSPITGKVVAVNGAIKEDYSILFRDPYDKGWLMLLDPEQLEDELQYLRPLDSELDPKYHITRVSETQDRDFLLLRGFYPQKPEI